jgi:uncharacterized protein
MGVLQNPAEWEPAKGPELPRRANVRNLPGMVMKAETLDEFERRIQERVAAPVVQFDSAHDLSHIRRVVRAAKDIARREGGALEVVIPAAWLHDLVVVPKSSPDRGRASQLSAEAAIALLREIEYPEKWLAPIAHAIAAHSFSAGIEPETLEARIVQDADRLDALGAIGLARCFATAGALGTALYCETDPFAAARDLDDRRWALDHLPKKLLRVADSMRTVVGASLARERAEFLRSFLRELARELPEVPGGDESQPP